MFYPALTGSKTPTSKFANARALGGRSTARKRPIGEG
ncbi:spermidine/putrescine ABC transporter ATP-binding protein [Bacillus mycoides]|nr:spermidine/putrescine ABC transporter ATP-binding protein [Bacillus mycoides]